MTTSQKILKTASSYLGQDASPNDNAPDELGCAETVSNILFEAGYAIPITVSTIQLNHFFSISKDWKMVLSPQPGDILVSPTGEGGENGIKIGHCGIVMEDLKIASNDSKTGTFIKNYTLQSWKKYYENKGGFPLYFYRAVSKPLPSPEMPPDEAKMVSDGLKVATQALTVPSLRPFARGLVSSLSAFMKKYIK